MSCHDARETFSELIDGALDPVARVAVDAHVAGCPECRRELDRLERVVTLLRAVEPVRAPVGFVDRVVEAARPAPWYRRVGERLPRLRPFGVPVEAVAIVLVATLAVFVFERTPLLQQAAREETAPSLLGERPDATPKTRLGPTTPLRGGDVPRSPAVPEHAARASDPVAGAKQGGAANDPQAAPGSTAALVTGETAPRPTADLRRDRAGTEDPGSPGRQESGPDAGARAPRGAPGDLAVRLEASDSARASTMRPEMPGATRESETRTDPPAAVRERAMRSDAAGDTRELPTPPSSPGAVSAPATRSAPPGAPAAPAPMPIPPGAMRDPATRSDPPGPAPESAKSSGGTRDPVARPDTSGRAPTAPAPTVMRQKRGDLPDAPANVGSSPGKSRPSDQSSDEPAGSASDARRRAAVPYATPRGAAARSGPRIAGRLAVADPEAAGRDLTALLSRVGGAELRRREEGAVVVVDVIVPGPHYAVFASGLARIGTWTPDASPSDSAAELIVTLRMTR
jgi:hypothetical protein